MESSRARCFSERLESDVLESEEASEAAAMTQTRAEFGPRSAT
jgi:hypothetical protein